MIKEKMLKFLILEEIRKHQIPIDKEKYDRKKLLKNWLELKKEFLSEYTLLHMKYVELICFNDIISLTNMQNNEEFLIMENYKITPNELYLIHSILLYEDDTSYISRFLKICKATDIDVISLLESLQNKGIILKAYKIPNKGDIFKPEEVLINQNFIKQYHKASFELGQELFEVYPQFATINGIITPIRAVSKKFDSLEDFFRFYGKTIHYNSDLHNHIIELINWAKENTTLINCSLCNFVIDRKWVDIEALKNGDRGNINFDTVKML